VMLSHSPFALEMTKQVLRANQDAANIGAAIALENRTQVLAGSSGDFAEAVAARFEGRSPRWATEHGADEHATEHGADEHATEHGADEH
jgi:enoyl-CoA hydratase